MNTTDTKDTINQTNNGISAKVIADSINEQGKRITTFELEFHRYILSEMNTHRVASKNTASSRAIPIRKVIEAVRTNPAVPVYFGSHQVGMQAGAELPEQAKAEAKRIWLEQAEQACKVAEQLTALGGAKEWVNRLLEPYCFIKQVFTATEFNNFFALRDSEYAQPEIRDLARKMKQVYNQSTPKMLKKQQWHLPYVKTKEQDNTQLYFNHDDEEITLEQALKLSASLVAQTSFRLQNSSQEKAEDIFRKLIESKPVHASPTEAQAMAWDSTPHEGWTQFHNNGLPGSGNLQGWIQYRQLIKDNVVLG